ncbi:MAG: type II toxin-antitoxin system Phd/YefM family antitoxin [Sulfurimonas sp.]|jgi:prevent-host-death family protein|nr:type II toxin-antitoxin system Phd/YefM family antitoxin [Sulfurimonadaceae bacterium]
MVSYTQKEMVGITELGKSLSGFIDKVSSKAVEKLVIIKHNKPEAVILSVDEYERMKEFQDFLENLEIAQIIKERVLDKKEPIKMYSYEEMMERLRERGLDV